MSDESSLPPLSSASIDWEAVWRSLDWDQNHHQETTEEVLARRAERYAIPLAEDTASDLGTLPVLLFSRGQERYAVPVTYVLQGLDSVRVTPLPCVPPFYRGVINLRGRILSVMDLARFWNVQAGDLPGAPKLIVLSASDLQIALQVDDILGVTDIPVHDVTPAVAAGIGLDHVQGVSSGGAVIVDIEGLFKDRRLIIHEEA